MMDRTHETVQDQPFFPDRDVPCPGCGYNLRGLVEPQCPECGKAFNPLLLSQQFVAGWRPVPSTRWIMWNMYMRPATFWHLPEVRLDEGPSMGQLATFVLLAASPAVGAAVFMLVATLARGAGGAGAWYAVLGVWTWVCVSFLAELLVVVVLHVVLAWLPWPRQLARDGRPCAEVIVTYCAAWLVPVVPLLMLLWALLSWGGALGSVFLYTVVLVDASALAVCCWRWARALYSGALAVSGSRALGVWYVASNPLWYIALLMVGKAF